uniref:Uncharacterized protein n=1 Tax=Romanomermis culicivorax TaxID=13658 RepID=A0A915IFB0_ROMCU
MKKREIKKGKMKARKATNELRTSGGGNILLIPLFMGQYDIQITLVENEKRRIKIEEEKMVKIR